MWFVRRYGASEENPVFRGPSQVAEFENDCLPLKDLLGPNTAKRGLERLEPLKRTPSSRLFLPHLTTWRAQPGPVKPHEIAELPGLWTAPLCAGSKRA